MATKTVVPEFEDRVGRRGYSSQTAFVGPSTDYTAAFAWTFDLRSMAEALLYCADTAGGPVYFYAVTSDSPTLAEVQAGQIYDADGVAVSITPVLDKWTPIPQEVMRAGRVVIFDATANATLTSIIGKT